MTFGEYLRQLREASGLGLRDFSRVAKLSRSHIHYLETDQRRPGDATIRKLAPALGVSTKELLEARDSQATATELTLLLREAGPLSDEQRKQLLEIAHEVLDESEAKKVRR